MKNNPISPTMLEKRLRSGVPPLREPNPSRVDNACARLASPPALTPLRDPRTFVRPLLRVAACFAVLFGIALLVHLKSQPPTSPTLPSFKLSDIPFVVNAQSLEDALAVEANDLALDLTDLSAVINQHTLAILF